MTLGEFLKVYDAETDLWVTMMYPTNNDWQGVRVVYDVERSLRGCGWGIAGNDVSLHKDWLESTVIKIRPANKYGEARLVCEYNVS